MEQEQEVSTAPMEEEGAMEQSSSFLEAPANLEYDMREKMTPAMFLEMFVFIQVFTEDQYTNAFLNEIKSIEDRTKILKNFRELYEVLRKAYRRKFTTTSLAAPTVEDVVVAEAATQLIAIQKSVPPGELVSLNTTAPADITQSGVSAVPRERKRRKLNEK